MIRFVMVGGFLGAGKTTAIARLARCFTDQGHRVGIVTNDQAYDLVDTKSLRAQGFDVGEVPGACFCCKFDDLVATAQDLQQHNRPDIIITEPVGSCTDLVATVIEPLKMLHGDDYAIAPLCVLLKPEHGKKILEDKPSSGFSPKAAYIFLKQLEEADIIAINKVDKLAPDEQEHLKQLILDRYPDKEVLFTSGRSGAGFDELLQRLGETRSARPLMDVDYDVYADGEAELGWLNCNVDVDAAVPLELDQLAQQLVKNIATRLSEAGAEAAHLKVLAEAAENSAIANLVGSEVDVELSVPSGAHARQTRVVVNARVVCAPEDLEEHVRVALAELEQALNAQATLRDVQRFRPGRPTPTHRVTAG